MLKITKLPDKEKVYDFTVKKNHNFFANGILVSNCVEITQPTKPISSIYSPEGEVGICVLSALNLLELPNEAAIKKACKYAVESLEGVIDYQNYPVLAGEKFCTNRRSLGIGVTNYAGYLAKNKLSWGSEEALSETHSLMEMIQWNLINASCDLAKELGPCEKFSDSRYSEGLMPIDWYNKNVDNICKPHYNMDWDQLRKKVKKYGLRHSSLSAIMPCESSSVIQNSTNGIEPIRGHLIYKKAKNGVLKQLVPNFYSKRKYYDKAWDFEGNQRIIETAAVIQKFTDMAMSLNLYYNYDQYEGGNIPLSILIKDQLLSYKLGIKTLYYANSPDGDGQHEGCSGGACSI